MTGLANIALDDLSWPKQKLAAFDLVDRIAASNRRVLGLFRMLSGNCELRRFKDLTTSGWIAQGGERLKKS